MNAKEHVDREFINILKNSEGVLSKRQDIQIIVSEEDLLNIISCIGYNEILKHRLTDELASAILRN